MKKPIRKIDISLVGTDYHAVVVFLFLIVKMVMLEQVRSRIALIKPHVVESRQLVMMVVLSCPRAGVINLRRLIDLSLTAVLVGDLGMGQAHTSRPITDRTWHNIQVKNC